MDKLGEVVDDGKYYCHTLGYWQFQSHVGEPKSTWNRQRLSCGRWLLVAGFASRTLRTGSNKIRYILFGSGKKRQFAADSG